MADELRDWDKSLHPALCLAVITVKWDKAATSQGSWEDRSYHMGLADVYLGRAKGTVGANCHQKDLHCSDPQSLHTDLVDVSRGCTQMTPGKPQQHSSEWENRCWDI